MLVGLALLHSKRVLAWQAQRGVGHGRRHSFLRSRSSLQLPSTFNHSTRTATNTAIGYHDSSKQMDDEMVLAKKSLPLLTTTTSNKSEENTLMKENQFQVTAPFAPTGDQPQAIDRLVHQVQRGDQYSILRGITGTGKTLVMAHTIARLGRPTLVLCHNKTLAAQLARELRSCLKHNHVQLFVSYYNHYVPESYNEVSGRYNAKKSSVNDELDALRHLATRALVQHSDVVVVASVSCIYGLGMPKSYLDASIQWKVGDVVAETIDDVTEILETLLYRHVGDDDHSETDDLSRGQYELCDLSSSTEGNDGDGDAGAIIFLWPPSDSFPMRVDLDATSDGSLQVSQISVGQLNGMSTVKDATIFPAKHHITESEEQFEEALRRIQDELKERVHELKTEGNHMEADRLLKRVSQDLLLLRETNTCPGVENYSRHMALREAGEPPDTLLDYFGFANKTRDDGWLLLVDESHVTLPQLKAMYGGDQARKRKLVKHGYRLPSALDNRPLRDVEFWKRIEQAVFVSATPSKQEIGLVADIEDNDPIDMLIRPTYVCDPEIEVRPTKDQLQDLLREVKLRAEIGERTLAISLTKRDAEDMADFLIENGIAATFIHSGLNTHERSDALKALQSGEIDCLVGVNLLREGLDLPQVSLVAVLNADTEGFLRSETALLQTIGRAARNKNGMAIFYANKDTESMKRCMDATQYRRKVQLEYNRVNNKKIKSTEGSSTQSIFDLLKDQIEHETSVDSATKNVQTTIPQHQLDMASLLDPAESEPRRRRLSNGTIETDHVPSKPGVYFWKDADDNVLYIGKAKRLRSRVKSYLSPSAKHSSRINVMLKKADQVEFILTPSDRDALALESKLIKHHQPPYNVLLKDDVSYPYVCASIGDAFPQFMIVPRRQDGIKAAKYKYFGPYQHYSEINTVLQRIEESYGLRSLSFQARFGSIEKSHYHDEFNRALQEVFETGSPENNQGLQSMRKEFEEASNLFESPYNLCRDVVAVGSHGDDSSVVAHVMQLRDGMVTAQFSYPCNVGFNMKTSEDLSDVLQTVLAEQHYPSGEAPQNNGASFFPDEILVQYPITNTRRLKEVIRNTRNSVEPDRKGEKTNIRTVRSRGPRRDADERVMRCAVENADQAAYQRSLVDAPHSVLSSVDGTASKELADMLGLKSTPERIECYDISHTQGMASVGSRVVFVDGRPAPELYRKFNIKTVKGVDDYASIQEVLERRLNHVWVNGDSTLVNKDDPWHLPDLIVIDGGKGQLSAALKGMAKADVFANSWMMEGGPQENGEIFEETYDGLAGKIPTPENEKRWTTVPIVALAKEHEQVYVPQQSEPINSRADTAALLLLRALRDESHRFALSSHRKRRSKVMLS